MISPQVLGFTPTSLPDRRWIINIAYSLIPQLQIFTGNNDIDELVSVPLEFVEGAAFFDPYIKVSKRPIFTKTQETKDREKIYKLRRHLAKKERRVNYMHSEARRINNEISEIQANIDIVNPNEVDIE